LSEYERAPKKDARNGVNTLCHRYPRPLADEQK
jgi:hypothetical protein